MSSQPANTPFEPSAEAPLPPPPPEEKSTESMRLKIRRGRLARSLRPDPSGAPEIREPDDLFALLGEIDGAARVPKDAVDNADDAAPE